MEFRKNAISSSSVSRQHGTQCAEMYDCLSGHAAAIGRLWLGLSLYCLEKTASRGEQGSPGRTSRDFERKNAMDERPREFSKSAKFLVTILTCLRGPIVRIARLRKQMFGAMTRALQITIVISLLIRKIRRTTTPMKKCARATLRIIGLSRFATIPIRRSLVEAARLFFIFDAVCIGRQPVARLWRKQI